MKLVTQDPFAIRSVDHLEEVYGGCNAASTVKEVDRLIPEYRAYIEASPFCILSTVGPEGLDGSPRGDLPGFVRIVDDRTLMLPDRRGNNRVDSLRNIVRDPRVALLFLVPGVDNTLRVNGRAWLSLEPALLASFAVEDKPPRSVAVIKIDTAYFQCARALKRSRLWSQASRVDPATLPTAGEMLAAASGGTVGGAAYDREWPERAAKSMW